MGMWEGVVNACFIKNIIIVSHLINKTYCEMAVEC